MSEEDDPIVALEDVFDSIDEEKAIVMGGIDTRDCCTFIKGYMKRQALYTCTTCLDVSSTNAGFCYPCLIHCHEGHETIELYTKRNFRCDCGNSKFGKQRCLLWEEKDDENSENRYNANFSNHYCVCMRPYPDDEYEGNEEMMQCVICEDWFHGEHLNMPENESIKSSEEYEEITCYRCLLKYPFLCAYAMTHMDQRFSSKSASTEVPSALSELNSKCKRAKMDSLEAPALCSPTLRDADGCRLPRILAELGLRVSNPRNIKISELGYYDENEVSSVFWPAGWREQLCTCLDCQSMYASSNLEFLLDPQDTMSYYLKLGEQRAAEIDVEEDRALNKTLSELPHHLAITVAEGVGQLKKSIEEFLMQKRESGHVITEAEVKSFFENLRTQRQLWP